MTSKALQLIMAAMRTANSASRGPVKVIRSSLGAHRKPKIRQFVRKINPRSYNEMVKETVKHPRTQEDITAYIAQLKRLQSTARDPFTQLSMRGYPKTPVVTNQPGFWKGYNPYTEGGRRAHSSFMPSLGPSTQRPGKFHPGYRTGGTPGRIDKLKEKIKFKANKLIETGHTVDDYVKTDNLGNIIGRDSIGSWVAYVKEMARLGHKPTMKGYKFWIGE